MVIVDELTWMVITTITLKNDLVNVYHNVYHISCPTSVATEEKNESKHLNVLPNFKELWVYIKDFVVPESNVSKEKNTKV